MLISFPYDFTHFMKFLFYRLGWLNYNLKFLISFSEGIYIISDDETLKSNIFLLTANYYEIRYYSIIYIDHLNTIKMEISYYIWWILYFSYRSCYYKLFFKTIFGTVVNLYVIIFGTVVIKKCIIDIFSKLFEYLKVFIKCYVIFLRG